MDLTPIITLAIGLAVGVALGIWWYRHSLKAHPGKAEAIVAEAKAARDQLRGEYFDKFGPKP